MKTFQILSLAAAAVVLASPAAAQLSSGGGPLDAMGDVLTTDGCTGVLTGPTTQVLQGGARLRAPKLVMVKERLPSSDGGAGGACGETVRLEAYGGVFYTNADRRFRAEQAIYDAKTQSLTLTGNVVVAQGRNVQRSDRLVINTATGATRSDGKRVRMVIYPTASSARTAEAR
jgi:lipopolysaccharide export system protein LptA